MKLLISVSILDTDGARELKIRTHKVKVISFMYIK